jgi:hypothetical protein
MAAGPNMARRNMATSATARRICAASWRGRGYGREWDGDPLRSVTELIVAGICLQDHIVSTPGFTVLVLMAFITTAATSATIRLLRRRETPSPRPVLYHVSSII